MKNTAKDYYDDILKNRTNMFMINEILNDALRDNIVPTKKENGVYYYDYLCHVAKQCGFKFATDWELL